jgi:hypothetical protein
MRIERTITSVSWIPSEAVAGLAKMPFSGGIAHYDAPPPDALGGDGPTSLEALRQADRFRFANELRAFVEVDDGLIVDAGYLSSGMIGSTTVALGVGAVTVAAVPLPDRHDAPEHGDGWVRFRQTAGGRTGLPAPRTVAHPPFVQYHAPIAWSTLELTIHADGRSEGTLIGASPFPRHWVYGDDGALAAKSGLIDFKAWYKHAFGQHTPWGDLDSPALVTEVESALERELSARIMRDGAKPKIRTARAGERLVRQGDAGDELFVLLDGVLAVDHDGTELGQLGPGAVFGERAVLEGGRRTSTLTAVTPCKLAVAHASAVDVEALTALADAHRREQAIGT